MEKKGQQKRVPPSYDNLNFDAQSEQLSSAQSDDEDPENDGAVELLEAPESLPNVPSDVPRTLTYNKPSLAEEDIYEACIRYVQDHCCYGSRFVKEMNLRDIENDSAFHYTLETFCERRESGLRSVPYIGQYIDGADNGPPPNPWDIIAQPQFLFQKGKVKMEIPHTAYVKPCDVCRGNCRVRCTFCSGMGGRTCSPCNGSGRRSDGSCMCPFCSGMGRKRCFPCDGTGQVKCTKCNSMGNIKCYQILIVKWLNFTEEFFTSTQNLPQKYIKTVTGNNMLSEEQNRLTPIVNAPYESINEASLNLMNRQQQDFRHMRILRQRHVLRSIPLTKVFYEWRGKNGEFYVYGLEKDVYFKNYPQPGCCCTCL